MRWLFTTYDVMSHNVTAKKRLGNGQKCSVTVTNCDITLLSVINHYKSLYDIKYYIETSGVNKAALVA
jgi:hypothetical protein